MGFLWWRPQKSPKVAGDEHCTSECALLRILAQRRYSKADIPAGLEVYLARTQKYAKMNAGRAIEVIKSPGLHKTVQKGYFGKLNRAGVKI